MLEQIFIVVFVVLAALFTGIVMFLSSVLRNTFNGMTVEEYQRVYGAIIRAGRKSLLINTIVLIPIFTLIAYLVAGYGNPFFIIGALLYIIGSFAASRFINEPTYTRLLQTDVTETEELSSIRSKLNGGNIARAVLSFIGIALVSLSLFF